MKNNLDSKLHFEYISSVRILANFDSIAKKLLQGITRVLAEPLLADIQGKRLSES